MSLCAFADKHSPYNLQYCREYIFGSENEYGYVFKQPQDGTCTFFDKITIYFRSYDKFP